jgi:hypothetical protein
MPENESLILMAIALSKGRNFSTVKLASLMGCTPFDVLVASVSLAAQGRVALSVPKTLSMSLLARSEETELVIDAELVDANESDQNTLTAPTVPGMPDDAHWDWESESAA